MRKAFDLRPLDFGDVLSRSFSLFTANFVGCLRWFGIFWLLPMLVVAGLLYAALQPYDWVGVPGGEAPSVFEASRYSAFFWLLKLAGLVFAFTTGAAGIYYMTARVYVGGNPSLSEVTRAVASRFGHVAGAGFLHELAIVGITVCCLAPPILLWKADNEGGAILTGMLLWLGWLPLLLWYLSVYSLNTPTVMLDDAEAGEAFTRSAFLTKSMRMRLAGLAVVTAMVAGAPGIPGLLSIPSVLGKALLVKEGLPALGVAVDLLWDAVILPLFFIPLVVYYFDMRSRRESYDLAVMARNFGIAEGEMARYRFNPDLGYTPKGYKGPRPKREKVVRMPQQRTAPRPMPAGPWGVQPGIPGSQWPQQPNPQWGPPPQNPQWPQQNPQWGPPPQNPQWGPPPQQPQWPPQQPALPPGQNPFYGRGNG